MYAPKEMFDPVELSQRDAHVASATRLWLSRPWLRDCCCCCCCC